MNQCIGAVIGDQVNSYFIMVRLSAVVVLIINVSLEISQEQIESE